MVECDEMSSLYDEMQLGLKLAIAKRTFSGSTQELPRTSSQTGITRRTDIIEFELLVEFVEALFVLSVA